MANSPTKSFEDYILDERTRLNSQREEILERRATIDEELGEVERELNAIAAYEAAKQGRPLPTKHIVISAPTGRGQRHSGRREEVLDVIAQAPNGIGRADILEALGVKGDKKGEQSVSNALSNLKKSGKVDNPEGLYVVLETEDA